MLSDTCKIHKKQNKPQQKKPSRSLVSHKAIVRKPLKQSNEKYIFLISTHLTRGVFS